MSSATAVSRARVSMTAFTAVRAVLAAVLAIVTTFTGTPLHTAGFGLIVFGAFAIAQGLVVAGGTRSFAVSRAGRSLHLLRALLLVVVGVLSLSLAAGASTGALLTAEAIGFLGSGALEVLAGLRRADSTAASRDLVTVGGLELVVGAMLAIILPDAIFAVGVLSAWGAVVAVYLGIAAVSIARREKVSA